MQNSKKDIDIYVPELNNMDKKKFQAGTLACDLGSNLRIHIKNCYYFKIKKKKMFESDTLFISEDQKVKASSY